MYNAEAVVADAGGSATAADTGASATHAYTAVLSDANSSSDVLAAGVGIDDRTAA